METEILLSVMIFAGAILTAVGYLWRVSKKGRARFDRIEQQGGTRLLGKSLLEMGYWSLQPVARFMVWLNITPNTISVVSLGLGLVAGISAARGAFGAAALVLAIASLLDVVDGMVARLTNRVTEVGYVLDSQIDRYVEFFFIGGVALYYRPWVALQVLALCALLGSYIVSYTTLMARFKQVTIPPGSVLMRRAERLVYLILGAALTPLSNLWFEKSDYPLGYPLLFVLALIASIANFSAVAQLVKLLKELKKREVPVAHRPVLGLKQKVAQKQSA